MDTLITPNFSIREFIQPSGYGIIETPYPEEWIEKRLLPLCNVLEFIRSELRDMPVEIISGYRSPEYNRRHHIANPGAVVKSQHCYGRAADIRVEHFDPSDVENVIIRLHESNLIKIGGLGIYKTFIHVDIRDSKELQRWKG